MQHELNQAYGALDQEKVPTNEPQPDPNSRDDPLVSSQAQRNQLYEDLMGQFRRGVCAFNLEALGVLKPTDEADEVMQAMKSSMPTAMPLKQPLQQQKPAVANMGQPRVMAHKKVMQQGLPQGTREVVVRSKTATGLEQENYINKQVTNVPLKVTDDCSTHFFEWI